MARRLYPPWTALLGAFFLFVISLACLAGEQAGAAVVAGMLAGVCAGQAWAKWSYRYDFVVEDTCPSCGTQVMVSMRRITSGRRVKPE